jgi:hypothetical protein
LLKDEVGVLACLVARLGHWVDLNVGFIFFSDPDGNGWAVQQINNRD